MAKKTSKKKAKKDGRTRIGSKEAQEAYDAFTGEPEAKLEAAAKDLTKTKGEEITPDRLLNVLASAVAADWKVKNFPNYAKKGRAGRPAGEPPVSAAELVKLLNKHQTFKAVADELGKTSLTVKRWVAAHGIKASIDFGEDKTIYSV